MKHIKEMLTLLVIFTIIPFAFANSEGSCIGNQPPIIKNHILTYDGYGTLSLEIDISNNGKWVKDLIFTMNSSTSGMIWNGNKIKTNGTTILMGAPPSGTYNYAITITDECGQIDHFNSTEPFALTNTKTPPVLSNVYPNITQVKTDSSFSITFKSDPVDNVLYNLTVLYPDNITRNTYTGNASDASIFIDGSVYNPGVYNWNLHLMDGWLNKSNTVEGKFKVVEPYNGPVFVTHTVTLNVTSQGD